MKTRNLLLLAGIILMSSAILYTGCKKKEDPKPDPTFVVTVQNQGDSIHFGAYCSSDDIKLIKLTIKDPQNIPYLYNGGGQVLLKDQLIVIQNAYARLIGIWSFTFDGSVVSDDRSFSVTTTTNITPK